MNHKRGGINFPYHSFDLSKLAALKPTLHSDATTVNEILSRFFLLHGFHNNYFAYFLSAEEHGHPSVVKSIKCGIECFV